jgi:hypothetical protein
MLLLPSRLKRPMSVSNCFVKKKKVEHYVKPCCMFRWRCQVTGCPGQPRFRRSRSRHTRWVPTSPAGLRIRIRVIFGSWIRIRMAWECKVGSGSAIKYKFRSFRGSDWSCGGPGTLTMEAWRLKIEPWRVSGPVIADSHHLKWTAWSGSSLKWKAGSGSAIKWCGSATLPTSIRTFVESEFGFGLSGELGLPDQSPVFNYDKKTEKLKKIANCFFGLHWSPWRTSKLHDKHRLNMELVLLSLFGLNVHSSTHWLRPRNPPPLRILAHILRCYWSAKIDDISLWPLMRSLQSRMRTKSPWKHKNLKKISPFLRIICLLGATDLLNLIQICITGL